MRDNIQNLEFDEWIPKFIEIAQYEPGIISNKLGVIRYVFVDEFQDITNERLSLLKLILNSKTTFTTVIGDPNQSIYGYERVQQGGNRSPKDNYDDFAKSYNPLIPAVFNRLINLYLSASRALPTSSILITSPLHNPGT